MADPATLLPPSSTALERALARTAGRFNPASIVPTLWNPDTCPPAVLPYLAWALSVDEWDHGWSIEKKRAVIREAPEIHRRKGTLGAIRRSLSALGHPDAEIIERSDHVRRDGSTPRDGAHRRFGAAGWASYRVSLYRPITVDQAMQIQRVLRATQRNCVRLVAIKYDQSAFRHNGAVLRNSSYARGTVNTALI